MSLRWRFPANEAGEDEGLADSGIETFRGSPFSGLARECAQNSLDAARPAADDSAEQVVVSFVKQTVPTASIPNVSELLAAVEDCLSRARETAQEKEVAFFVRACQMLRNDSIDVLQVVDEGTTGLVGPCLPGTPFHALVKSKGVSRKDDDTSGGSFGIGKNAVYAVSALRSVFYSTVYCDSDDIDQFLAQGKAILVSHRSASGMEFKATGYCGQAEQYMPVSDRAVLPEWLCREERGTTVSALGFLAEEGWEWSMTASLVCNFFAAIHREKIKFEIDGDLIIDRDSLRGLFDRAEVVEAAQAKGFQDELKTSHNLYRCLTSPLKQSYDKEFPNLGTIRLSLLIEDKLQKAVGMIRHGMFITSNFRNFRDNLLRFPLQKDFIAVIEPYDHAAASNIRALESPRHDELSPERIDDPKLKKQLRQAVDSMNAWVRETIKRHTSVPHEAETLLDDLNEFFCAPEDNADRVQHSGEAETDPCSIKVMPARRSPPSGPSSEGGEEGGGRRNRGNGRKRGNGTRTDSGDRGDGKGGGASVAYFALRNTINPEEARSRTIFFTPRSSGLVKIAVVAEGIAEAQKLPVISAEGLDVSNGAVTMKLQAAERQKIRVTLADPYAGPISLRISASAEAEHED